MTKLYELPNGRRFITDIDKSTKICNVTEPQLDIIIGDLNRYAEMCEHAIPIPDNATNGEVIMAMLNPYKICEYKYSVHVYMTEKDFLNGNYQMNLDSDWWNAPYKAESDG